MTLFKLLLLSFILPLLITLYTFFAHLLPILSGSSLLIVAAALAAVLILPLFGLIISRRFAGLGRREREGALPEEGGRGAAATTPQVSGLGSPLTQRQADQRGDIQGLIAAFNDIFQTAASNPAEQRHLQELLANLVAVASDLTAEPDFDRLFPLIVGRVTQVMEADRTSLYVIDWDKGELWTKVAEGVETIRVPLGRGISGAVALTGETVNVPDAWELPYFDRSFDEAHRYRTRSVLCVPVRGRTGQNIGVLQVINKLGRERFDERDEVFLKGLASQVGIALENSLLIDELKLSFTSSVSTLAAVVDARHPLTAGHSRRVTEYSLCVARKLGLDRTETEVIRLAALLHDIGKIGIRDNVLLKEGPFTPAERVEMDAHPAKTRQILDKFHFPRSLRAVPAVAACHHEKLNGRGYPDGLAGEMISRGARIIAVADVFDALTSRREYPKYQGGEVLDRGPMPIERAVSILRQEAGSHFDAEVVEAFVQCLPDCIRLFRGEHFEPAYADEGLRYLASERL